MQLHVFPFHWFFDGDPIIFRMLFRVSIKIIQGIGFSLYKQWMPFGFFDRLFQFSAFTSLTCIYKILATLPVISCSAESEMSRLEIIKNRLRSTSSDERLQDSSLDNLVIFASRAVARKTFRWGFDLWVLHWSNWWDFPSIKFFLTVTNSLNPIKRYIAVNSNRFDHW